MIDAVPTDAHVSTITFVTTYAKRERQQLADLLLRVGPDEPTLCAGWTTRDLAAHLVTRERLRLTATSFPEIVAMMRNPPWWSPLSNRLTDELVNTGEFFIHHEDVRRARPGWQPRELSPGHSAALWRGARFVGRIGLRRLRLPVRVVGDGAGEFTVGDGPPLVVRGAAGELAMFLSGRQAHSRVSIEGPPDQVERLRTARLGLA
jgi:Mycothiol maleylpyruvate isomerase N-terminal domain